MSTTIDQLCEAVAENVKTKSWYNQRLFIEHDGHTYAVGIKAFGKWVQRIETNGRVGGVEETKTIKALKENLRKELIGMFR